MILILGVSSMSNELSHSYKKQHLVIAIKTMFFYVYPTVKPQIDGGGELE